MDLRPLAPLLQEKAQKELNEEPNRIASDVNTIREWLEKQPHLKSVNPNDQWIVSFLRGSKYSLEKTKSKLDMYYTLRSLLPEIFSNRNPFDPTTQEILKTGSFLPLKNLGAEDARRICIESLKSGESRNYSLLDVFKVSFMILDILILEDDNCIVAGLDSLVELEGVGIRTISQWTPATANKTVVITERALPIRMKDTHLIHIPAGFETAYSILRRFLSEKMKSRYFVYSKNYEALYKTIPRSILPKEYGGEYGTIQELRDYWKTKVESYCDWFLREESVRSDEALRPGLPTISSDLFGVEGSFRKLDVD